MTFQMPLQPVPARRGHVAVVLVTLSVVAGVLVWQPWSAGSATVPDATATPTGATAQGGSAPPSPTPTVVPYASPRALPILPAGSLVAAPPAERFRPRWSVVGVTDLPDGELRVTQLPVVTTSGFIEGRSAAEVCRIGRLRSAFVVILPARRVRLIGIAAPASGIGAATEMTRVDKTPLAAYEVPVRSLGGDGEVLAAARLFVRGDFLLWGEGVYRFLTEGSDGTPHFLYACLVGPALVDGT